MWIKKINKIFLLFFITSNSQMSFSQKQNFFHHASIASISEQKLTKSIEQNLEKIEEEIEKEEKNIENLLGSGPLTYMLSDNNVFELFSFGRRCDGRWFIRKNKKNFYLREMIAKRDLFLLRIARRRIEKLKDYRPFLDYFIHLGKEFWEAFYQIFPVHRDCCARESSMAGRVGSFCMSVSEFEEDLKDVQLLR
ncbi:hypothetical protein P618_200003 [Holospora obtusa F1]|uniref:Uncharacterized protein n=1 Tax=Holospora obtusa F1 TaxID=1399147 RepID=W6TFI8_HOLOB|nr:hypothetical protein [Holospora obtusa]ETZ07786.1 hypothetical protein P618_200003 [Holospora obtusa F1]